MSVLSCLISEVHSIVREEYAERERYRKKRASETVLEPNQHSDATRQSTMKWRESSRCKNMTGIDAFVSDNIDNNLCELDDAADDDHEKYGIHMEPFSYKAF